MVQSFGVEPTSSLTLDAGYWRYGTAGFCVGSSASHSCFCMVFLPFLFSYVSFCNGNIYFVPMYVGSDVTCFDFTG